MIDGVSVDDFAQVAHVLVPQVDEVKVTLFGFPVRDRLDDLAGQTSCRREGQRVPWMGPCTSTHAPLYVLHEVIRIVDEGVAEAAHETLLEIDEVPLDDARVQRLAQKLAVLLVRWSVAHKARPTIETYKSYD